MIAASIRALCIDRAQPGLCIQIAAIAVRALGQRKDAVLEVEMTDDAGFLQSFGNLFGRFARLEFINYSHADQIADLHFDRHGATGGAAGFTQTSAMFKPAPQTFEVGMMQQGFFHKQAGKKEKGEGILPVCL